VFAVVVLLLVSALTIYLGSAAEAYRLAEGGSPFVSARALLWATVALIMVAVSLLAMSVVTVNLGSPTCSPAPRAAGEAGSRR
jgi:hypothetical protein